MDIEITRCKEKDQTRALLLSTRSATPAFPLLAADELGLFKAEGLDVSIELLPTGVQALRSGDLDLLADRSVYRIPREFPGWKGAKLVVALAQATPWLLVVRADLAAKQGDLSAIKGLRLRAGEGPVQALKQMAMAIS